jgi:GST-like protein
VLDRRLAEHAYLGGADYTIADIATWPWYGGLVLGHQYDAAEFLQVHTYTHLQRWAKAIAQRPAVQRGRKVNRNWGPAHDQLPERHAASDFDALPPAP